MKTHLRSSSPISEPKNKYKGIILAKDFNCIRDFKDCCYWLGWRFATCHFPIRYDEKSNQKIIKDFYKWKENQ